MAIVLLEACILDCYTLLVDGNEDNPSLCTLSRPFRKRSDYAKMLDRLASLYSNRDPLWPEASIVGEFSSKDRENSIRKNQKENAARRAAFWRIAGRIRTDWKRLVEAGDFIRPFRNDVVAHLTVKLDETTNRYGFCELPRLDELCRTVEEILPVITRSVANLAALLVGGGDRLNIFERMAKDDAAIFWGLKSVALRGTSRSRAGSVARQ